MYPTPHTTFKYFGFFGSISIFSRIFLTCNIIVYLFIYFDGVGKGVWIDLRDELEIENFLDQIQAREVEVKDVTKGFTFKVKLDLTDNELEVVLCGGQLRYLKRELVKQGVIDKE